VRKIGLASVIAFPLMIVASQAAAQEGIEFRESFLLGIGSAHINIGPQKYRVYQSIETQVGSFGYSATGFGGNRKFSLLGNITSPNPLAAQIVQLDETTRGQINANATLGIPRVDAGVLFNGTNATTSSVIATVWTMANPEEYFKQLKKHYGSNYTEFGRDDFRFITAVVVTSKFQTTSSLSFNSKLNFTIQLSPTSANPSSSLIPKIDATISAGVDQNKAVTLLGNNVVGYQWHVVCWENGAPATHVLDDFQTRLNARHRSRVAMAISFSLRSRLARKRPRPRWSPAILAAVP
jgi:hypothetical protein